MQITGSLPQVALGTAKTYEHLASKFSFRVEGDGAVEPSLLDKFSAEAPLVESTDERRFRAFLKKEAALHSSSSHTPAAQGSKMLQELATGTLGDGWKVKDFSAPLGGAPRVFTLELNSGTASQSVSIDRYGATPQLTVGSSARVDGWKVDHSISGTLDAGVLDGESVVESAYILRS